MPANRAAAMGLGRQNVSRRHWRKRRPVFEISTRFSHELFPKGRGGAGGAFPRTAATLLKNAGRTAYLALMLLRSRLDLERRRFIKGHSLAGLPAFLKTEGNAG